MLKRCYLLILMIFILSSCAHHSNPLKNNPAEVNYGTRTQQTRGITTFNQIHAEGRINLHLHTGYKKPRVMLKGDPRDLAQVQTIVRNGTLHISLGSGFPKYGEVSMDILGQFLNKIHYEGAGVITGSRLNTRYLDLYLANQGTTRLGGAIGLQKLVVNGTGLTQISGITSYHMKVHLIGSPKVQLSGKVNLAELNIDGDAWLSLYWVKSNNLMIKASKAARIQLAGTVNRLDIELWDHAQFNGRYLRAQRSFTKTHGKSLAEISSINHQSSLATDASDIYYYNIPNTRADFMGFDGSVLDMRDLSSPYLDRDYDRYNKHFP